MLSIYWFTFGLGGVFLLLTIVLGADSDSDSDFDADHGGFDADHGGFDADHGIIDDMGHINAAEHGDVSHPGMLDLLFLIISIRFWSFFSTFFGLTGVGLSYISGGGLFTLITSVIMGLIAGFGASMLFKYMSRGNVSSDVKPGELLGQKGEVILPFDTEEEGKIRLIVKGQIIDKIAVSSKGMCEIGQTITVIKILPDSKVVVRADLNKQTTDKDNTHNSRLEQSERNTAQKEETK